MLLSCFCGSTNYRCSSSTVQNFITHYLLKAIYKTHKHDSSIFVQYPILHMSTGSSIIEAVKGAVMVDDRIKTARQERDRIS